MQTNTTSLRDTKQSVLSDSLIGDFLQKLSVPIVSEGLLLISVALFWYEGFLPTIGLGFLGGAIIPTLLLVFALVFSDKSKIKVPRPIIFSIVFFVLALFSGVFASGRGISPVLILSGWALFAQFLVAILVVQGVGNPKRLLRNIIYLALPMIAVGAYQFIANQTTSKLWVSASETGISTRAFAFFGSPNVLGAVLVMVVLVALGLFLSEKNKSMAAISVLATMVTVFTFSRSAWIGLIVGVITMLVIRNWKLVIYSPLALFALLFSQVRTRLYTIFTPGYWLDSSLDGRLWSINNGMHIWAKYPVLGSGPGTYGGKLALSASSPVYLQGIQNGYVALYFTDNQWLQLLVQTGLVGVIIFALFAAEMFYHLVSQYNEHKDALALGIMGAFVAFIITGFFGNVLEFGAIAVPMGVMLGISFSETKLA